MTHGSIARALARHAIAALLMTPCLAHAQSYSGSAFEIDDAGHLLTNLHVVASCKSIHIRKEHLDDVVELVASDADKDLALLYDIGRMTDRIGYRRTTGGIALPYARFPDDKHHFLFGERVIVAGYPLPQYLGGINVTTGTISAMTGPNNDEGVFQLTAPVQGGNSGGPVLDKRGTVVGVVVATLDPIKLQKFDNTVPQNVNFAIQGRVARDFVRRVIGRAAIDEGAVEPERLTTSIATGATQFTYQVLCLN